MFGVGSDFECILKIKGFSTEEEGNINNSNNLISLSH